MKILDFGLSRSLEPDADRSRVGPDRRHAALHEPRAGQRRPGHAALRPLQPRLRPLSDDHGPAPLRRPDAIAVLTALAVATPEPPDRLNPGLPPAASALITSLLARDTSVAPGSAAPWSRRSRPSSGRSPGPRRRVADLRSGWPSWSSWGFPGRGPPSARRSSASLAIRGSSSSRRPTRGSWSRSSEAGGW